MTTQIVQTKMAEDFDKDKIFVENRSMSMVESENPSIYSNGEKVKDSNSTENIVKNGNSEVSNKEGEIFYNGDRNKSVAESANAGNPSSSSNGEKIKDSNYIENIVQHGNPIFEFLLTCMVLLSLPIKPFYDSVKASSPLLQQSEERATDALKFTLNVGSAKYATLRKMTDEMKAKILGHLNAVLEFLSLCEIRENTTAVLDYIDRIYLNIVPAIPDVTPYFDSNDQSLPIKTRCFYMFCNLMQRLTVHSLQFVQHALNFFERRQTTES